MSINIFTSILTFFINGVLSAHILLKNPKSALNRIFFFFSATVAWWALCVFLMQVVKSSVVGFFVASFSMMALAIMAVLYFHFMLVFTERNKILSRKINFFWIYFPAIFFSILIWFTDLIAVWPQTIKYGGYYREPAEFFVFFLLYFAIYFSASLFFGGKFYLKEEDGRKREQAKYILIGSLVPCAAGLVTEGILPMLGIYLNVQMGMILMLFWAPCIAYATLKYGFLAVTPRMAAENIIENMPGFLVVLDQDLSISFTNARILDILGYGRGDLRGKPFESVVSVEDRGDFREKIWHSRLQDYQADYLAKNGEKIPVSISSYPLKYDERGGHTIGVVTVGRDMRQMRQFIRRLEKSKGDLEGKNAELKKNRSDLEDKNRELQEKCLYVGQLNKTMIDRELEMVRLKEEIANLKEKSVRSDVE